MVEGSILCLDAAGDCFRLEWGKGGGTAYYSRQFRGGKLHEQLLPFIDTFVGDYRLSLSGLGGIAVNQGPGHYARLRSSLIWAKTTAYFLKIPILGFDSFTIIDNYLERLSSSKMGNIDFTWMVFPLRIYLYRVSSHRLFSCAYWKGKRIGRVTSFTSLPPPPHRLSDEKFIELLNIDRTDGFVQGSLEDVIKSIVNLGKKQEKVFFLFDGGRMDNEDNPNLSYPNSHNEKEQESLIKLNTLERHLQQIHPKSPEISLYHCVQSRVNDSTLKDFVYSPLAINPKYYREFGEITGQ